jgi:hypothetical protein
MKRKIIAVLVALVVSGPAWALDNKGNYITYGVNSCTKYIDVYSRTKLTGRSTYDGPLDAWFSFGWIHGYVTAYNESVRNYRSDIFYSMSMNNAYKWMASWCRDNHQKNVHDALKALISSQSGFTREELLGK